MFLFLSGAVMMGSFVAAAFFWRYWKRTRDPFFALFTMAWALMGIERLCLAVRNVPEEPAFGLYFIRLAAFLLIIVAIISKNRTRKGRHTR